MNFKMGFSFGIAAYALSVAPAFAANAINIAAAHLDSGYAYYVAQDFGTPGEDNPACAR